MAFLLLIALAVALKHLPSRVAYASSVTPVLSHPDAVCRSCHQQIYDRYEQTPMAMGSGLAVNGLDPAQLTAKDLVHRPSGITYRVFLRDGQAYLAYNRSATQGRPPLEGEHRLEYFIGSGKRGRTYLYQQENLWFEAPINWYGKKQLWDMAPAYGNIRFLPDPMPVDPNCLHCHTGDARPVTNAARNYYPAEPFGSAGVGCAACHGEPTAHLASKRGPGPILNPDKLSPGRRDSICLQCHLEGAVAIYRPGKSLAAFRPGDDLSQSVVYFIDSSRAQLGGRASSQYEALLRSACRRAAGDRLTCTTCHDPHSSPLPAERATFFRAKCLACHTGELIATRHHPEQQDCTLCHMPTRKTIDIPHEQLTDHDIEARPNTSGLTLSNLSHSDSPELITVDGKPASDRELGLAYAQLAQQGDHTSGERALRLLQRAERAGSDDPELHDQLGFLLQISGSPGLAADQYLAALRQLPHDITAAGNLAVIDAARGQTSEAIRLLTQVVQDDPSQTAAGLNLAFLECQLGRKPEAIQTVQRMIAFNPDSLAAHRLLESGNYGDQHCDLR
jgi:tetratricopeptide (TPR) repeat protein